MIHGRTQARLRSFCFFMLGLMAMSGGCQQWSTYPPVELNVAARLQRPAAEPVPTIIAKTVQYAQDNLGVAKDLPLNLPEGVPSTVYDKVFAHLGGGGGRPMTLATEKAIHIKEVRTRGFDAQVDLIYPRSDGLHQFATVTLGHYPLERWGVKSVRRWEIRDVKAPGPNYVPPPPAETKDEKKAGG